MVSALLCVVVDDTPLEVLVLSRVGGAGSSAESVRATLNRAVSVAAVAASFYAGGAILVLRYMIADWLRR